MRPLEQGSPDVWEYIALWSRSLITLHTVCNRRACAPVHASIPRTPRRARAPVLARGPAVSLYIASREKTREKSSKTLYIVYGLDGSRAIGWKYHSYLASQRRQWRRRAQAQEGQTSQFVIRRQPAVPRCPRGEAEPGRQGAAILALLVSLCYTDRPATLPVGGRPLGGLSHTQAEAC